MTWKPIIGSLLAVGGILLLAQSQEDKETRGRNRRGENDERLGPTPGLSVAVGDSIVAHGGFLRILGRLYGYRWDNQGIVGNSTRQMLRRAPNWARSIYSEILIMGNINDISVNRSPDTIPQSRVHDVEVERQSNGSPLHAQQEDEHPVQCALEDMI